MERTTDRIGVIGGGLGGLAAAATLAARGYRVVLFERNAWLGGKAAVLAERGFRFDMGPTILTLPCVLGRIFAEAGRDLRRDLDLVRLDPQWRCFFDDGSTPRPRRPTSTRMAARSTPSPPGPARPRATAGFLAVSERLHDISERFFFWRSVGSIARHVRRRHDLQGLDARRRAGPAHGPSVAGTVRSHVPRAAGGADARPLHPVRRLPPDASPAVLCGIAHMQTAGRHLVPRGRHPRRARGAGAAWPATSASRSGPAADGAAHPHRQGGAVAGVETDAGERVALAAVVSNCDAVRTHRELLDGANRRRKRFETPPQIRARLLRRGALPRPRPRLRPPRSTTTSSSRRDPDEEFDSIYRRGEPAPDPTCYVCAPAAHRARRGPGGRRGALRPRPHAVPAPAPRLEADAPRLPRSDPRQAEDGPPAWRTSRSASSSSRPDPAGHPRPLPRARTARSTAWPATAGCSGAFKPGNRSRDVSGLYLAGGAAHPGPGMPMVLMSGWIAADALDQDGLVARGNPAVLRRSA